MAQPRPAAVPVLIVYGRESLLVSPVLMGGMARAVPNGKLVEIESAGHLPQLDNPEAFSHAVARFCFDELERWRHFPEQFP